YPHHFTFAVARAAAVSFLWHSPSGYPDRALPGTLLCGARTFLDGTIPARLPGGLDRYCTRGFGGNNPADQAGCEQHEAGGQQEGDRQPDVDQRAGDSRADRLAGPVRPIETAKARPYQAGSVRLWRMENMLTSKGPFASPAISNAAAASQALPAKASSATATPATRSVTIMTTASRPSLLIRPGMSAEGTGAIP